MTCDEVKKLVWHKKSDQDEYDLWMTENIDVESVHDTWILLKFMWEMGPCPPSPTTPFYPLIMESLRYKWQSNES